MNFSGQDQVSLYFIGIQESDELGEVGKGGNFITEPCTCQWDSKYYKHLFIRDFSSLWNAVHIFSIFLQWCCFFGPAIFKYFKFSSNTTLRLPACTVWPSLLIFFFHFYSFPTDHSVKSLRDSSEGLLLAIFLLRGTKNIFFKPSLALRRGRLRPVQSVFFLPGVCYSRNDRAWGKLPGDDCWHWENCPGPVSSDHSRDAHQRTGVIAVSVRWGRAKRPISSEPRVTRWILIWKGL